MVVWTIENYRREQVCYSAGSVYDALVDNFDASEEDAIEAEGWCELAYVGEVYQGDGFTICVEEE